MFICCYLQELEVLSLPQRACVATPASTPDHPQKGGLRGLGKAAEILSPLENAVQQLTAVRSAACSMACKEVGLQALPQNRLTQMTDSNRAGMVVMQA